MNKKFVIAQLYTHGGTLAYYDGAGGLFSDNRARATKFDHQHEAEAMLAELHDRGKMTRFNFTGYYTILPIYVFY